MPKARISSPANHGMAGKAGRQVASKHPANNAAAVAGATNGRRAETVLAVAGIGFPESGSRNEQRQATTSPSSRKPNPPPISDERELR
ncbi:MAG: hypothetical protein R3F01_03805 [Lysobacteraceae bacterium]